MKQQACLGLCFALVWLLSEASQHVLRKPVTAEKALRTNAIAPNIAVKHLTFREQPVLLVLLFQIVRAA